MNIEVKHGIYTFNGADIDFSFYTNLNAVNKIKFVNTVTETIVDTNYNSIIRDLIFDFVIIEIFTDVDLTEIHESNDSLNKIEEFLSQTKVVDIVKSNMTNGLLQELNRAVDDNISYRTGIYKNNLSEALSNLVTTLNNKINEINISDLDELATKLDKININKQRKNGSTYDI